jgi:hypothetical protein
MQLDRTALLAIARTRALMKAERAADIAEMEREFASEIRSIRQEMVDARRELAEARRELRSRIMSPEDIAALDQAEYITDIVASLQRATQFADPLAIAVGLTRVARALGASTPEARCFLALEMLQTAISLDADVVGAKWQ